MENKDFIKDK